MARVRESTSDLSARAKKIFKRLKKSYPDAHCELDHSGPFELLVATILSAQCTDRRVNLVTPALFSRYPAAAQLAEAEPSELEEMIRSTGFFRSKTRSLIGMSRAIVADHAGEVPATLEVLVTLPGVGRKTANVILGNAFGINEGVVVDTHVARVSGRLGLTRHKEPERIEADLMKLFPRNEWAMLAHLLIWHGRRICGARSPRCSDCVLADICPSAGMAGSR